MDHRQHYQQPQQQQQQQQQQHEYLTLISRAPRTRGDGASMSSADSTYGSSAADVGTPSATHDISRVNYHVKHLETFAKSLEDSAGRAFPNRGRSLQRYSKVQVLLLHWKSDDLFVLPELEDLEQCMRLDYGFDTDIFSIPSENSHLELMLKLGALIKEHEDTQTLFVVYYGGHARIDESRQSTWCATRHSGSPTLQWSAIQTLLERSVSDTLILLDCCAGAASATFPNGKSITETISASSWDAIAPDPGRYSFTNALIEVLQQWKVRTFSAAMLHAEVLARLKHPRPITINGKHFEARSTPVHFMMTSNHKAPSIELGRIVPGSRRPPSPPEESQSTLPLPNAPIATGRGPTEGQGTEPTEDQPHVMISLALEDNQQLDLDAWEQWLANFPALAKYVKVQGVFKSHSTLLLLSLPVMIWDLLPEDHACSFVAFIRSNNMITAAKSTETPEAVSVLSPHETEEAVSDEPDTISLSGDTMQGTLPPDVRPSIGGAQISYGPDRTPTNYVSGPSDSKSVVSLLQAPLRTTRTAPSYQDDDIKRKPVINESRSSKWTVYTPGEKVPECPRFSAHVVARLEEYFHTDPDPNVAAIEFYASNLGVQPRDISVWFYHRHRKEREAYTQQNLRIEKQPQEDIKATRMIMPGHLNRLLEIYPSQILLVDLRPAADFERSHIHRAANLRAPLSFLQSASLEMIEEAFTDDESRASFAKWYSAKCVVMYDRTVEFPWECPMADVLCDKFRAKGWRGRFFVLKGPYREFSASYDRYIVGSRMSKDAEAYIGGLQKTPPITADQVVEAQDQYDEWLRLVENEDRVPTTHLVPQKQAERQRAMQENQRLLEAEFQARFPDLYERSLGGPPPSWDGDKKRREEAYEAPMVAPLSRALEKMQETGLAAPHHRGDSKSGGDAYDMKLGSSGRSGGYPPDKAVGDGGRGGGGYPLDKLGGDVPMEDHDDAVGPGQAGGESQKKRQQQQPGFWKRIRTSRS